MQEIGRLLLVTGIALALIGGLLIVTARFFPGLGNLPGDLRYESDNVRIYFPFATMIIVSIVATILLNIIIRIFRR